MVVTVGLVANGFASILAGQLCYEGHWVIGLAVLANVIYTGCKEWAK